MDRDYEAFCLADRLFFDVQGVDGSAGDDFAPLLPDPGPQWTQLTRDVWRVLWPSGAVARRQGWKIHASATMDNAERVLTEVHRYCVARKIPFKYLRTRSILLARNSKYAPRSASGKLITIYPADDAEFARVLTELAAVLEGERGPYILSDLRYGGGPLYARYGGFAEQWVEHGGKRVPAIAKPDGTLVPDLRKPVFAVPGWVQVPACLGPHLARRKAGDPGQFPFQVTKSLHFSNGGGVYLATRESDGTQVVLKEARPFCGLDREHADAVTRLDREHQILTLLAGIPGVPAVYERFRSGSTNSWRWSTWLVRPSAVGWRPTTRSPISRVRAKWPSTASACSPSSTGSRRCSTRCTSAAWSSAICTGATSCSTSTTLSA
ncbi:hypothetical protein [Amycolatopsis minnesotensis]|uniref:RamC N-terminal domain-containing protein n=1 Tax=Amycolatopsis minnesotensis TaxID=337894 RepID=A0ABP5BMH6_9PSEU